MPVSACGLKGAVQVPPTAILQCLVDDFLDLFQAALDAAGCTPAQLVDLFSTAYKLHVSNAPASSPVHMSGAVKQAAVR